ncbi:unnamed protein product [Echinostoma caproni]|uniref:Derlin n=1 Tax=Echinostoma caproni TaxID=27848 RepID=A0A183BBT3_9TREM|nr:unnamed protein product [Echinostoma caproni]
MDPATIVQNVTNTTADSVEPTPAGLFLSSTVLFLLALGPIFFGSLRSKAPQNESDVEVVTSRNAAVFPIYASGALFGIYIVFKVHFSGYWYLVLRYTCRFAMFLLFIRSPHWIANDCIAYSLAILAIEYIKLNKFVNGCLLLGGLFFYDIFWVFGTPVMVSVAKSLEAPIKSKQIVFINRLHHSRLSLPA